MNKQINSLEKKKPKLKDKELQMNNSHKRNKSKKLQQLLRLLKPRLFLPRIKKRKRKLPLK